MKVLFIEDDPALCAFYAKRYGEDSRYQVLVVETGEEAIDQHRRFQFDMAVIDFELAGRLNGIEAAERLLLVKPLQLIFCSDHYDSALYQSAILLQPLLILRKPPEEAVLSEALAETRKKLYGLNGGHAQASGGSQ